VAVRVVVVADPTGGPRVVLGVPKAQDAWAQPQKLPSRFEAEKGQIGRWRAQDPDQEAPHFFHDAPVHHGLGHALQAFLFLAHSEFVVGTAHHNQTSRSLDPPSEIFDFVPPGLNGVLADDEEQGGPGLEEGVVRLPSGSLQGVEREPKVDAGRHSGC